MKIIKLLKHLISQKPLFLDKYTKDASALAEVIDCSYTDINTKQQNPERVGKSGNLIVNWYIPSFTNAFYGGVMTILRTADYLFNNYGMKQRFLICGDANPDFILNQITQAFPNLHSAEVIILNSIQAIQNIPVSDFSIASLWTTAYVLLKVENTGLKFYFIQDFEPLFYPAGSTYAQAEATYRFGFYGIANTITLKNIYENEYGGTAAHFTPCVDTKVFYPDVSFKKADVTKRIFFYGRPGHPRNGFELAVAAMRKLKIIYGSNVEILSAGADWNPKEYGLEGIVENLGLLNYIETGNLYRSCHIGLSMMMTKHPSYLPFEMMACGVLVISNFNSSTQWLLKDKENCLIANPSTSCITEKISEAINRYEDFEVIINNATNYIKYNYADWSSELQKIYGFIQAIAYDNCLVQSNGAVFGSSVFLIKNGCRHYVPDLEWLVQHNFTFPSDIKYVTDEVILGYRPSSPAAHKWNLDDWISPPKTLSMTGMREIASSRLKGSGIECGAAASPFPLPSECYVKYIDRFSKKELQDQLYVGQQLYNLIDPDILTDLNNLDGIEDDSLNFVIACHVIEHLKNPLGALESCYKKLRTGGSVVLVIPDKERTFDRSRKTTSLEHLILDFQSPSRDRDMEDYFDFYKLASHFSDEERVDSMIKKAFIEEVDIHYHTFTYESFIELVNYIHNNICPWSSIWSQPTLSNSEEAVEFYFVLTK